MRTLWHFTRMDYAGHSTPKKEVEGGEGRWEGRIREGGGREKGGREGENERGGGRREGGEEECKSIS